jgi:hypothetical protein
VEVGLEGRQLLPGAVGLAGREFQGERRNGQAPHFAADAPAVVGQADELEAAAQVAPHHGIEPVDVFGAVLGTPFHADDVSLPHHSLRSRHPQSL